MGKRAKSGGRLQIHRETRRNVSAESLQRVAGGDIVGEANPSPKTNAWTAGEGIGAIQALAVCGFGGR